METPIRLAVRLAEASDDDLVELVDLLRDAGAGEVERPRFGETQADVRGVESEIADVVATVTPAVGVVERIVKTIRGWLGQRPRRTIKLVIGKDSIEITGFSTAAQDELVRAFVQRVCDQD
ncbi:effector-associated constant component EACC1 [Kutzneria sp. CA-103260]|uniref:effector-associated constant component EACC1 n=1 Tax=Kutzneria sp. CA-103260 TaxID=2802641 RepID=UPI001BA57B72|nr:hypothetical protein [Kutzneria sp. CA-103260]QUQ67107.1 hypothetical protein JJ691_48390 [Kutzneria sp. CA-103260]